MRQILLLLLFAITASAQETLIRETMASKTDTYVEVEALFSGASPGGYAPIRVTIVNNQKSSKSIELSFETHSNYIRGNSASSDFSITAPENKTVVKELLVPLVPPSSERSRYSYSGGYLFINLETHLTGDFGNANNSLNLQLATNQPAVLLSEALYTPNGSSLDNATRSSASSGGYTSGAASFATRFDPKQVSDNWLAYSGWDSILMLASEWSQVSAGGQTAILAWVRMGGQLVIYQDHSGSADALGLPVDDPGMGFISLQPNPPGLHLPAEETIDLVGVKSGAQPGHSVIQDAYRSSWPLQNRFGIKLFRYGLFIVVLLIFGILVGPVNLFVFAKSGKRHRLFITTPIISLGASAVMIFLIILQDGFGGNGSRIVLMEVRPDDGQNAAYIHQEQFCRTGVLVSSGFTMDTPAFISPVPIKSSRWARYTEDSSGDFSIQPNGSKMELSGDWFQSRSEHGHVLAAVVSTRGRIEATGSPDSMISTFDFPIQKFYYQDENGAWFRSANISTGKKFQLTPVDFSMVDPEIQKIAASFEGNLPSTFIRLTKRRQHYFAVTADAPGIATHSSIRWKQTTTIITGPIATP
ncbi:hypothetical protein JIN85_14510 [Luteolibacter pohnpeiensis]|uniref:Uncharacterized protein n=2 Tax=Luteolibacter pohnpeiensis TaxID=454153 RepID=A0A934SCI9_9BACT|nr:hypothetical protein [Luteolibacter pohnpeiensis]